MEEAPAQLYIGSDTEDSDIVSEASDATGDSWAVLNQPEDEDEDEEIDESEENESEETEGEASGEEDLPEPGFLRQADAPGPPEVPQTRLFQQNQEVLELCRSQTIFQYVLLAVLALLLFRGLTAPSRAELIDEPEAQYLRVLQERAAWESNYSQLQQLWFDCRRQVDAIHEPAASCGGRTEGCTARLAKLEGDYEKLADQCAKQEDDLRWTSGGGGVLSEARAERSQAFAELQLEDEQGLVALDVGCVRRLARLVAMSKAQVVVSSTWGKDPALYEHLLSSLQRLGGDALRNAVVDVTPRGSLGRGFEILQWLEASKPPDGGAWRAAILEDSEGHFASIEAAGLGACLVKTQLGPELEEGLTEEAAEKALKLLKEAEAQADATGTHGRRDVGTASRELKAWNDRGTEVVAGEAFGDFDPLVFPGQMAREAKECARNQARLEEEVESLRSSEEGCEEGWSSCRERLAEELHTQTELRRETSACKQSFEQMLQSCGDEKDTEAYRDQLEGEVTTLRAQQLATQQRYAQLNAALTEAQELRRAENADWKQKHEKLRAELAESQQIRQEAEERAEALKQEAEYLKRKLHGEQQGEHPWWFHQVEDFRKRMREEWLRHAQKQGNPYLKEWLDHARKETEDVADRLREKYEHARRKGVGRSGCSRQASADSRPSADGAPIGKGPPKAAVEFKTLVLTPSVWQNQRPRFVGHISLEPVEGQEKPRVFLRPKSGAEFRLWPDSPKGALQWLSLSAAPEEGF
ncbi:unnamed protein product [Effrenium voratum]|uniref:Uncharacterized protein n=1 Tax=Effrenium voratum TaxID=2562239 RepID=A0AA36HUW5_9DINO|nr:unnamed protein product [Effrenium voratum]